MKKSRIWAYVKCTLLNRKFSAPHGTFRISLSGRFVDVVARRQDNPGRKKEAAVGGGLLIHVSEARCFFIPASTLLIKKTPRKEDP